MSASTSPTTNGASSVEQRPSRRRFLRNAALGAGGVATGAVLGPAALAWRGPSDAEIRSQELKGNAFHADLGMWPIIWSVPVSTNAVTLTFDDGPDPDYTPKILEILARNDVLATFNMMGWNCVQHPEIVRAVVDAGHELGNHSWSHLDLATVDAPTALSEMRQGRDAIERISGQTVHFFRPPRGALSGAAIRYAAEEQLSILMWTINGAPRGVKPPKAIVDHLVNGVHPGYIVGLHDGIGRGTFRPNAGFAQELTARRTAELAALPAAIDGLLARDLRFVTAGGLLAEPRHADAPGPMARHDGSDEADPEADLTEQ